MWHLRADGDLRGTIGGFPLSDTETFDGGQRRVEVSGASLDLVGTLPINQYFSVLARAGVLASKVATNRSWYQATVIFSPNIIPIDYLIQPIPRRANTFEYGLGVKYNVNSSWSIGSEWQRVNMSDCRMGTSIRWMLRLFLSFSRFDLAVNLRPAVFIGTVCAQFDA